MKRALKIAIAALLLAASLCAALAQLISPGDAANKDFYDNSATPPVLCRWNEATQSYVEVLGDVLGSDDFLNKTLADPNSKFCKHSPVKETAPRVQ